MVGKTNVRWQNGRLKLGPSRNVLEQIRDQFEGDRQVGKRVRWLTYAVGVFFVLTFVAGVLAFVANRQRRRALRQLYLAQSANASLIASPPGQQWEGVKLATESIERWLTIERRISHEFAKSLYSTLDDSHELFTLASGTGKAIKRFKVARNGTTILTIDSDERLEVWDLCGKLRHGRFSTRLWATGAQNS